MNKYLNSEVEADRIIDQSLLAAAVFNQLDQEQVDKITKAVFEASFNSRHELAVLANEETEIGKWQDKVIKNVVASQIVYNDIKNLKTVGILSENEEDGITEIAHPLGPIFAMIPVTNPTSTVIFKIMIAMKTRNPIIIGPHPKAKKSSCRAAQICYEAAVKAGAPEHAVQWLENGTMELTQSLMSHSKLALVLATGGSSLVRAAYGSGKPALGVGPGNVPVYIDTSADISFAVKEIIISKTFDNGTICASEQSIVVEKSISEEVKKQFTASNAFFLNSVQTTALEETVFDKERWLMRGEIVGKSAAVIASMAGIQCPEDTQLLIAPMFGVGKNYPLSSEILAPVLAYYEVDTFEDAVNICIDLNFHGGMGHTASIFSQDDTRIKEFAALINAGRIVVNMPSSQGAVGGIYSKLKPSFTLGCGTGGNNITTDNVSVSNLINIQRIAARRENPVIGKVGLDRYLEKNFTATELEKIL